MPARPYRWRKRQSIHLPPPLTHHLRLYRLASVNSDKLAPGTFNSVNIQRQFPLEVKWLQELKIIQRYQVLELARGSEKMELHQWILGVSSRNQVDHLFPDR
jgi:hypothetical protein